MRAIRDLSDTEFYYARQYVMDGYTHAFVAKLYDVTALDFPRALRQTTRGNRRFLNDPLRCVLRPPKWTPDCMTAEEFELWHEGNEHTLKRPCDDCGLGFAIDMRMEGRCNGIPAGVEEDDEAEEGVAAA